MRGHVIVNKIDLATGRTIWTRETDNLVVLEGTEDVARLCAASGGFPISAIGFGSGITAPNVSDVFPLDAPAYYKAVDSRVVSIASLPAKITVSWSINVNTPKDYAAEDINVSEIALLTNPLGSALPSVDSNGSLATWSGPQAYIVGDTVVDANGNVQSVTTAGTSGGSTPTWATTIGATTADGSVVWTMRAGQGAGFRLFARALMPLGSQTTTVGFQSTWVLTV